MTGLNWMFTLVLGTNQLSFFLDKALILDDAVNSEWVEKKETLLDQNVMVFEFKLCVELKCCPNTHTQLNRQ